MCIRDRIVGGKEDGGYWADNLKEIKTVCHCGRKATMVLRLNEYGQITEDGNQIDIGGEEKYVSVCRKHFKEKNIG